MTDIHATVILTEIANLNRCALREFADSHGLKVKIDECGELIIPGKLGHIFYHSTVSGELVLGVLCMYQAPRKWSYVKRTFADHGMTITQGGDSEGVATFNSQDSVALGLAMKAIKCKFRRPVTPAQLENLAKAQAFARDAQEKGGLAPPNRPKNDGAGQGISGAKAVGF